MNPLLPFLALAAAGSTSAAESTVPAKPNVLFIISDDLNDALGAYGDPLAKTPNLDRLAARGVRFERAYCTFPVCGPSRNSLLTGLYPNTAGVLRNEVMFRDTIPTHTSLPQAFRQAGYVTARVGKVFHYGVPRSIGTAGHDDPASWELTVNPIGIDHPDREPNIFTLTPGMFGATLSWYASPEPDPRHTDGMVAREAAWLLDRFAKDAARPFFLAVGFFRPHTPFVAPEAPYFRLHDREKMPVHPTLDQQPSNVPKPALGSYRREEGQLTDNLRREAVQAYHASVSFLDAQVGLVVDELERLGLAGNTIIVFTSDHGYHLGEHGLWQKLSLFEESARVPLLLVAPGIAKPGSVVRAPVSLIDLYPTLAELAGVQAPGNLQGQSLVSFLENPGYEGRGWALTQVDRGGRGETVGDSQAAGYAGPPFMGYSLRTPQWRYNEWDEGREGRELYDHVTDPAEMVNLADDPAHAETVAKLSRQLREAVRASYPSDGKLPEILPGWRWSPNLSGQ